MVGHPPRDRPTKHRRRLGDLEKELRLHRLDDREIDSVKVTHIIIDIALKDPCDDDET